MKRIGTMLGLVCMGSLFAGCDSGIPAGAPAEMPTSSANEQFKNMMKTAGPNMQRKGKKAKTVDAPTAKESTTPEAP